MEDKKTRKPPAMEPTTPPPTPTAKAADKDELSDSAMATPDSKQSSGKQELIYIDPECRDQVQSMIDAATVVISSYGLVIEERNTLREEARQFSDLCKDIKEERDRILIDVAGAWDIMAKANMKHMSDLVKAKADHEEHVKKLRAKHKEEIEALNAKHERERSTIKKMIDEPRELRQTNQKLVIENKSLQKKVAASEKSKEDLKAMKKSMAKLEDQCGNHRRDLDAAQKKLTAESKRYIEFRSKYEDLECRSSDLHTFEETKEKLAAVMGTRDFLQAKCNELEKDIEYLKTRMAETDHVVTLNRQIATLRSDIVGLDAQVAELEADRDIKAPLVQIGAAVRMRFLAQAESIVKGNPRHLLDTVVIRSGNAAAHRADGTADASLFVSGFLSKDLDEEQFVNVYGAHVSLYRVSKPKWKKFVDLKATIRTSVSSGNSSTAQRHKATLIIDKLESFGLNIEDNEEADRLLRDLKNLAEDIVLRDLQSNSRGRCYTYLF